MFESLRPQVSAPDLVVLLQASPSALIDRIRQRGIAMEQNMSEEYLVQLSEAYTRFFHQYEEAPILIVNTASLNPIDREEDFEALVSQIANFRGRRAYFNLAGLDLEVVDEPGLAQLGGRHHHQRLAGLEVFVGGQAQVALTPNREVVGLPAPGRQDLTASLLKLKQVL